MQQIETKPREFGSQTVWKMDNGYGASVLHDLVGMLHTDHEDCYEIGVIGPDGNLTYKTDITSDVACYLTAVDVPRYLQAIAALDVDGCLPTGYPWP